MAAQSPYDPTAEEAPESLLELEIGAADVDLFAEGTLTTGIGGAVGLARDLTGSKAVRFPYPFPGLETVPFYNRVDLTISLWLLRRYFFETTISDEFQDSTLLFGYAGLPGEFVQSVLIGTTAIEMGAYPFLGFGDGSGALGQDAPGASALFQTEKSTHEFMVRLDAAREETITYRNGRIVTETTIDSGNYVRGRFFVLPDGNLETLSVYEETPDGEYAGSDGRAYRPVSLATETTFSLADGTLAFDRQPTGRVLVYYTKGGAPVGNAGLGAGSFFLLADGSPDPDQPAGFSFDDPEGLLSIYGANVNWAAATPEEKAQLESGYFRVTTELGGAPVHDALVLFEPGRYGPFEIAANYESPVTLSSSVAVGFTSPGGSALDLSPLVAEKRQSSGIVSVVAPGAAPRAYASRYPFADPAIDEPVPELYGPASRSHASRVRITLQQSSATDAITLDRSFIPGSVRIVRNGTPEREFQVLDSGEVAFSRPLTTTDSVDVRYRSRAAGEQQDTLLGIGNRIHLTAGVEVDAAFGMRWKPVRARFTTTPGESPGYLSLSAAAEYDGSRRPDPAPGQLSVRATAGASYAVPDATGVLRVAGMDGDPTRLAMAPEQLFPAPAPAVDPDPGDGIELTGATRGVLVYRDYSAESGPFGQRELTSFSLPGPDPLAGHTGPYPALSAGGGSEADYTGNVMALDFELAAGQNWVAGLARLPGGDADLSGTTLISGSFLVLGDPDVKIFLQVGAIAEDLDGDGRADAGRSLLDPHLAFNPAESGVSLDAGALWTDVIYTEDADGDGRLDPELPDLVLTRELAAAETEVWQPVTIQLTPAERRLLRSTRSVRIIVQRDADDGARPPGRVLLSDLVFYGSSFAVTSPSAAVTAREVPVTVAPPAADRFLSTGEVNRALAVSWTGLANDDPVELARWVEPVPASDYAELRLYALAQEPGAELTLVARGSSGVTAEWQSNPTPLSASEWSEVVVALPERSPGAVDRVLIRITGDATGEVLLDELSFWLPRNRIGATGSVTLEWRPEGVLRAGDVEVVRNLGITQSFTGRTPGFAQGLTAARTGVESATTVSAVILGAPVEAALTGSLGPSGPGLLAAHRISIPVPQARVTVTDSFRRNYLSLGETVKHSAGMTAGPLGPATLALGWNHEQTASGSATEWEAVGRLRSQGEGPGALTADLTLAGAEETPTELDTPTPIYPAEWSRSFGWMLPSRASGLGRELAIDGRFRLDTSPVGWEATTTANTSVSDQTGTLTSSLSAEMRLPVLFRNQVRVVPGIGRRLVLESSVPPPGSSPTFAADVRWAASLYGDQPYLLASTPVQELWGSTPAEEFERGTDGLTAAGYTPSVQIGLSRPIRSSPWSLIVPAGVQFSAERSLERRADAVRDGRSVTAELSFVAPNVLGRLGSSPFFSFYDTDQFVTSALAAVARRNAGNEDEYLEVRINIDQSTRLLWLTGRALDLSAVVSGTVTRPPAAAASVASASAAVTAAYEWKSPFAIDQWPRIAAWVGDKAALAHTETLTLSGDRAETTQRTATLRHATELSGGGRLTLSAYAGLGVGLATPGDARLLLGGLEAGVEGALRF